MLFTWDTTDLCIVFRSWHIHSTFTLIVSLLLIVVLCAGYEGLRDYSRRYEAGLNSRKIQLQGGRDNGSSKCTSQEYGHWMRRVPGLVARS